jgi:hypothetical protein
VSRRAQIAMSDAEVLAFLEQERIATCATLGPRGWPHLMPLWYVLRRAPENAATPRVWAWTYAASQKARNLERDPRATLQIEAGELYHELRGVMFECDVRLHHGQELVAALGREVFARYGAAREEPPLQELAPEVEAAVTAQAAKRVALEFVECRRASWDHRKLGGVY